MSDAWVPPALAWEITPTQLNVLIDTASPLAKRKHSPKVRKAAERIVKPKKAKRS
jgi:hypothetical protein